ncbi:hypothetical protein OC846_002713 [Tilletia horrida]|uniref:Small ribosomal subunit protein mS38 n=1 Tax=Tilletia horrida TaxID=155126 RepID=A0AAN6JSD5_9BASI|nr:hypothetical protein OC846_002713 [Tilletia horrida]KAK0567234.1 hypothetical protein OC861_002831 [Tilletia horrida]
MAASPATTATAFRRLGSASAVIRQHAAPRASVASSSQTRAQFLVTARTPSSYLSATRSTPLRVQARSTAPVLGSSSIRHAAAAQSADMDIVSYLDHLILRDQALLPASSSFQPAASALSLAPTATAEADSIHMDSVKRKRRKKMRKHKLKKLRKIQRSERQRLKK